MENLTDLLTNIFVSNKNYKTDSKKLDKLEEIQESVHDKEELSHEDSTEESKSSDDSSSDESSHSSSSESSNESSSEDHSSSSSSSSSSHSSSNETSHESSSEEGEVEEDEHDEDEDEDKEEKDNEEMSHKEKSKVESKMTNDKLEKTSSLRKLVLKASEFYKRNLLLVNNDHSKNIELLSELLFKLSKMSNVNDLYDSSLHIFTFNENKKDFRDMLLENPYLYFNNLIIKSTLSVPKLESTKRHIIIIDYNTITDFDKLNKLLTSNLNLHIIMYHNTYTSSLVDAFKLLGSNTLLINNKDRLKILQKRFYSKIVKNLVETHDDYFENINDDNLDVKYLIIKDKELRYS